MTEDTGPIALCRHEELARRENRLLAKRAAAAGTATPDAAAQAEQEQAAQRPGPDASR